MEKIFQPDWRFRKAYRTALVVLGSYFWLSLKSKLFGKKYYERHVLALHLKNAERVKSAVLELKGLFIKVGQLLSVLGNFLPEAFQKPLESLQDQITPRPFEEVRLRIEKALGKTPERLFASIDPTPLASASIGQAHQAVLHDGTKVVVKVQHAHIETIAQVDLEIIRKLTQWVAWFYQIKGIDYLYEQIRQMIEEELDFEQEARYMHQIRENLAQIPQFVIPEVIPEFSTQRVMTTTWQDGVKISNLEQIDAWGLHRRDIATRLLQLYSQMVFKDGIYHADPHPGNILIQSNGTLVLLDFGAVATLSTTMKDGIPQLIEAAIKNDIDAMVLAARKMGFIAQGQEAEVMAKRLIEALQHFIQNEVHLEGLNFKDIKVNPFNNSLADLVKETGLTRISGAVQVPRDWVLLNRMISLLLGISTTLDNSLNPLDVIRPYLKSMVMGQQTMLEFVGKMVKSTASTMIGLPDELHRVLQKLDKNQLDLRSSDNRLSARLLYAGIQQMLFALLLLACAAATAYFHLHQMHPIGHWCLGAAAISGFLFIRSLREGRSLIRKMDR